MTNRSRLAAAALGASLAVPLVVAPASADLVPLPTVDTTCLNATDIVQCEVSSLQGTVTGTVADVASQPPLIIGGTAGGTSGTSVTSVGGVPTPTGGTVQQHGTGHRAAIGKKRHRRLHRSGHHRRR